MITLPIEAAEVLSVPSSSGCGVNRGQGINLGNNLISFQFPLHRDAV